MKNHNCDENIDFNKLNFKGEVIDNRVVLETECEVCGNEIELSFIADWCTVYNENGHEIYDDTKYQL